MNRLLIILMSLVAVSAFGDPVSTNVTVRLGPVSVIGTYPSVMFKCNVTINNQSDKTLVATNLFAMSPGLALKVSDLDGKELQRTYAMPWITWRFTFSPGIHPLSNLFYGVKIINGHKHVEELSLPNAAKTVRLQIEGTLSGSSITSNIVEVKIR
jgi:hypothetical protein